MSSESPTSLSFSRVTQDLFVGYFLLTFNNRVAFSDREMEAQADPAKLRTELLGLRLDGEALQKSLKVM